MDYCLVVVLSVLLRFMEFGYFGIFIFSYATEYDKVNNTTIFTFQIIHWFMKKRLKWKKNLEVLEH